MPYLIYLRKSRADLEAESHGEGETLSRHEKSLMELAVKLNLEVTAIYREIVSGETISARPRMQQALCEVSQGLWEGVLVMEVERLARGDTKDQGTVAEAFKLSNTKIITPAKIYDPRNEFDEEYFEFGLFMSRREYKTINRRIQRGRIASLKEGKYIAGTAPYGYEKIRLQHDKGWTLAILPKEAETVRMIYQWYVNDSGTKGLSMSQICQRLDAGSIPPPRGSNWSPSSVSDILQNPVYTGMIRWQHRKVNKKLADGKIIETRPRNDDCLLVKGLHEAILSEELFLNAQALRTERARNLPSANRALQNPLAGLIICETCGRPMVRSSGHTKASYPVLRCAHAGCHNISTPLHLVETVLVEALEQWYCGFCLDQSDSVLINKRRFSCQQSGTPEILKQLKKARCALLKQQSCACDLLEQGIYTNALFEQRTKELNRRLQKNDAQRLSLLQHQDLLPPCSGLMDLYRSQSLASVKNHILHSLIDHASYLKTERSPKGKGNSANFQLTLFPLLPEYSLPPPDIEHNR